MVFNKKSGTTRVKRKGKSGEAKDEFTLAHVDFGIPMKCSGVHLGLNLTKAVQVAEINQVTCCRLHSLVVVVTKILRLGWNQTIISSATIGCS